MRLFRFLSLPFLFICTGCGLISFNHENASGHYVVERESCVPYAREVSGIELYGDAYSWWDQAPPHYERGNQPARGAVLVLRRTARMTSGHVAVVKDIVDATHIHVTHSNWGDGPISRRIIYDSMLAEDVSPNHDWTAVRFWNNDKNVFGFPYAAYGFIYP